MVQHSTLKNREPRDGEMPNIAVLLGPCHVARLTAGTIAKDMRGTTSDTKMVGIFASAEYYGKG